MNKTVSISLAGFSFIIDEHAYLKLSDYLKALRNYLEPSEADEVMNDIEIRMVEIFKEILSKREVINNQDVEFIINKLGKPEEIEKQEEAYFSDSSKKKSDSSREQKQLFRDPKRQKIAGVCAGLANYTGLDMTIMRVIWVVIFITLIPLPGSPLLLVGLYIILWIILPKAITATDFLKMKGEPVNFDNLKKESNKIVEFANKSGKEIGEFYNENKPIINQTSNGIITAIRYTMGVMFAILAVGCVVGIFSLITYFSENNEINKIAFFFDNNQYFQWIPSAFSVISVLLPAMIFTYLAIKLLSPKTKLNYVGYVFGGLTLIWIIMTIVLISIAINMTTKYSGVKYEKENIAIKTTSDSLILSKKNVDIPENFKSYWNGIFSDKKTIYDREQIDIDVIRKEITEPYLIIHKKADGYNVPLKMKVPVTIVDNKLSFPNYIAYPYYNIPQKSDHELS